MDESERMLSLQVALKCADLGHMAADLHIHIKWVRHTADASMAGFTRPLLRDIVKARHLCKVPDAVDHTEFSNVQPWILVDGQGMNSRAGLNTWAWYGHLFARACSDAVATTCNMKVCTLIRYSDITRCNVVTLSALTDTCMRASCMR